MLDLLESKSKRSSFFQGFYCGKIDGIYVMNGFYMSMRAAYCNEGEKIKWYTVSWPTDSLTWESFRGEVLGSTNPSTAPKGEIFSDDHVKYVPLIFISQNKQDPSAAPFSMITRNLD